MKSLNKKQYIILYVIIISIINLSIFITLTFIILNDKEKKEIISNNNYEIDFKKNIYYLGLNETISIEIENKKNIHYSLSADDNSIVKINETNITGLKHGKTEIIITLPDNTVKTAEVYVLKGLVNKPKEFDYKKEYLTCNYFTNEENQLLDKALQSRLDNVTYKSRASVVEAARFLTLNFEFRIPYFYENGRLNNYSGKEHVDGEGRYYHKGLYLSEQKYNEISAKLYGPSMWGCPLTNITKANSYGYYIGNKYPNGLDCSGFISWVLYNGGFDIGDTGAGETYRKDDLYDLGEKSLITDELLYSNKVKVGDLIAYSGHIAIIIGIDKDNFYIAETLPHLKGVVTKKYEKNKIKNTFTHIMLMDNIYKNDGKLTNLWY